MRKALAIWLAITVVATGFGVAAAIVGNMRYKEGSKAYQAALDYQQRAEAYQKAYQKAVDDWLKSDEAAKFKESNQKLMAEALTSLLRSNTLTYNDIKAAAEDLNKRTQTTAQKKAVEKIGNAPTPPVTSMDEAKEMLKNADRLLAFSEVIGYSYLILSIAYWVIIWGFRKRSVKPGEVATDGSGKNISA
ncbi:hypothetical protein [Neomoorella mulderi]|uniref:Uncharacterized protein n=1 Tax=Moorella mulderi DSM 14980 TaxID=1122241 RepID=A0A151ATI7_9FIRM|nr:hypothetical protein [Moorella mulderi]KYH30931.1 hypothetical protein MOMUL_28060 [Moorella mulderi DSM 14980]